MHAVPFNSVSMQSSELSAMDSPTDSDTESEPVSVSSGDRMQTAKSSTSTGSRKFSTEQTTALNSFYKNGMKGEAARFTVFISRASKKTGLSIAQVKVDLALI